jgi:NAD-dependent deacetylase
LDSSKIKLAADKIKQSFRVVAFTGAGISVESGIPPFRGPGGLWSKYDPEILEINHFFAYPEASWHVIKEIFYDSFSAAKPNPAHIVLSDMEKLGYLHCIITQNIDHMHQIAGSNNVIEYHGSSQRLICTRCNELFHFSSDIFINIPPLCKICNGILKPDFIFYGEAIPLDAAQRSLDETKYADLWLVIGTTGEVYPACSLPVEAKHNGKTIIEINVTPSSFTHSITDIFLQGKASEVTQALFKELNCQI